MALGAADPSHFSPTSRNTFLPVSSETNALVPPRTSATNYSESSFAVTLGPGDPPARTLSTPPVRTLPPWVRSFEVCEEDPDATARLLPAEIEDALVAQHNHSPYATSKSNRNKSAEAGNEPYYMDQETRESRWRRFVQISAYPHAGVVAEEKRVSFEWLNNNMGDYSQPWGARHDGSDTELGRVALRSKQRNLWTRLQRHLLSSPTVPLIIRLTVWIFSLCALSLGGSIRALAGRFDRYPGPSADMAIVVDAVALVYLVYITYDEYTSKPLGLRPPKAKMRLILLDIFFIIFDAANMTLAFVSLHDVQGTCTSAVINDVHDDRNDALCVRQKALASVLLVALIAWLLTFCISIFRLVERVSN